MSAAASQSTPTLPPKGAPIQSVLSAVEDIVQSGSVPALSELRAEAQTRVDLSSAIAVSLMRQGRLDDAIGVIEGFIERNGKSADAYDALGALHLGAENADQAIAGFRAALEIDPKAENPASNLYNLYINLRRYEDAIDLRKAHPQAKDGAPVRTLGMAQRLMLDGKSAMAASLLEPIANTADALCALGEANYRAGMPDPAHDAWAKALELEPEHLQTFVKQGIGLQIEHRYDEALESVEKAEALAPDMTSVKVTKAAILVGLQKYEDAVEILEKAEKKNADAWAVLSNAYLQLRRVQDAKDSAYKSLELEENNFFGRQNLVLALVAGHDNILAEKEARKTIDLIEEGFYKLGIAESTILHNQADTLGQALSRQGLANLAFEFRKKYCHDANVTLQFYQNYLFEMHYASGVDPEFIAQEHKKINRILSKEIPHDFGELDPEKRLKIGLLSADFRHHSCGYFMFTLLEGMKRHNADIVCISNIRGKGDDLTERFEENCAKWIDVSKKLDPELRELLIEEEIDIFIDCVGYTAGSRTDLFAMRAAPVQVTWLGYPDGSGLDTMDYRLTDSLAEPPNADRLYAEELIRLPHGFLCFPEYNGAPDVNPTPALANDFITFGSFNAVPKINDDVMRAWCDILKATPNSRLLLKSAYIEPESVENMKKRFTEQGISEDRIELTPWTPDKISHLALYARVDINLDPFPYNGTTTTMESTFMGVPTIVLRGDRHSGLVGVALNTRFGLPELIADDHDGYVRAAAELAADVQKLNTLRLGLRDRMRASEMMNANVFATDVYEALRAVWRKRCGATAADAEKTQDARAADGATIDVKTRGGVAVSVPPSLREISTYVLLEQEDWFEDDLGYLRRLAEPGWSVVDIGGNYGLYALNIANAIGPEGKLAVFEPSAQTASYLRRSIDANGLDDRVTLLQAAVSDTQGEAILDSAAAELKALTKTGKGETVKTVTLDSWSAEAGFEKVDFIKIDAEGAEPLIIDGGERFFTEGSPLVMIEVKHGNDIEFTALEKLEALGYRAYALAPGLDLLAPADPRAPRGALEAIDGYLLNLFAIKPDRAAALAARGKLVEHRIAAPDVDPEDWEAAFAGRAFWPSFQALKADFVDPTKQTAGATAYKRALARFAALHATEDAPTKLAHLEASLSDVLEALARGRTADRLATAARLLAMSGRRDPAARALREVKLALSRLDLTISEPFLPPLERYDAIDAKGDFIAWFEAAILEAFDRLSTFSSCFRGEDNHDVYAAVAENRFVSAEMLRRAQLSALRWRVATKIEATPRLQVESEDHLNPQLWMTKPQPAWAP